MESTAVQRFYRFHAYIYDYTRWMILHGRRRAVELMALSPESRVLEVGCGTGLNFRFILDVLDPSRGRLTGLDFSGDMLERAERRVAARSWPNVSLIQGDATTMSLGEKFDAVFFAYSLTMIPNWPQALQRGWEHLKPGGCMCVLDFGRFDSWGPLAPAMRGWLRANHVETLQPYIDTMKQICGDVKVHRWLGGYNFTAIARRPA